MRYTKLIQEINKRSKVPTKVITKVLHTMVEVTKETLVEGDFISLANLGTMELEYLPASFHMGQKSQQGRIKFTAHPFVLKEMVAGAMKLLEEEERE